MFALEEVNIFASAIIYLVGRCFPTGIWMSIRNFKRDAIFQDFRYYIGESYPVQVTAMPAELPGGISVRAGLKPFRAEIK